MYRATAVGQVWFETARFVDDDDADVPFWCVPWAGGRVYESATALDGDAGSRIDYDVFHAGAVDGDYVSGDARACEALRRRGHAIHVDPAIVVRRHRIATF